MSHFVDAHVHIRDMQGLDSVVAAGVAAVRDAGVRENALPGAARVQASEGGPRIVSALWAIYKQGGYGASFGVSAAGREEISAEIVRLAETGAGIIKVMASGLVSLREPGAITAGGFSEDELRFIVREARRHGLGVMAHANGEQAILSAARAGVRSIEHGFFMTRAALEVMASDGVFWTPTVGALARAAEGAGVSPEAKRFVHGLVKSHLAMIKTAQELGVPLAIGTDCVLPHRDYEAAYQAELAYFEQAGLSRAAALDIASAGGARLLGA